MVFEALDGIQVEMGPGDFYDIAPGHDAWVIGDEPSVQVDFQGVAGWAEAPTAGERTLATILFTDIVGSTVAAERMGNAGWRRLLMQHLEDVQAALARHRGHLVKSTGDGYLATFDSPAHAIAAAEGVALSARTLGIEIRAGVHTGEVELVDDDLGGLAVHLAARIMDAAGPGEVFVSSTVRDLLAGGSIRLAEAGTFELKGISGARILYRVEAAG
jgi:class 3 adenylate cyclase